MHNFRHITEDRRKYAQQLWEKFNTDLADAGMTLYYEYYMGGFFVADDSLTGGSADNCHNDSNILSQAELKQVVAEGSFDYRAPNNPPWFVELVEDGTSSLAIKEDT